MKLLPATASALALLALTTTAAAGPLTTTGDWSKDAPLSVDIDRGSRGDALAAIGKAAHLQIVAHGDEDGGPVTLHLRDVTAARALTLLYEDAKSPQTARRDGDAVIITEGEAPAAPAEEPTKAKRHGDGTFFGIVKIGPEDRYDDVEVVGGIAHIAGTIDGDLTVTGGIVTLERGAHVHGDISLTGGKLAIEDGVTVDGEVTNLGGTIEKPASVALHYGTATGDEVEKPARGKRLLDALATAATRFAWLFLAGVLALAFARPRADRVRAAFVRAPLRSLGLGLVAALGVATAAAVLAVTIVGLPLAAAVAGIAIAAAYGGAGLVLATAGDGLLAAHVPNPWKRLAIACAAFAALRLVPGVGGFLEAVVFLAGFGAVVTTRAGGDRAPEPAPATPYRG